MSRCLRRFAFDRLLTAAVLLAALAAVSPLFAAGGFGEAPKLGEEAPPFSLLDLDGQRVATIRFAQISIGHDGRALATDVLKALERLLR